MAKEIFISHSSKDAKISNTICRALEDRGLSCWIAPRDIGPGENFQESIVRAIRAAKIMVLIFSANANDSAEVKKELVLASQHKLAVIPVRIEDVVPGEAFAYELSTRQWVDLFSTGEAAIGRVGDQIKSMLSGSLGAAAEAPRPAPPPHRKSVAGLVVAGIVVAAGAAGAAYFVLQKPATAPSSQVASPTVAAAPTPPAPAAPAPSAAPASPPAAPAPVIAAVVPPPVPAPKPPAPAPKPAALPIAPPPKPAQAPPARPPATENGATPAVDQKDVAVADRSCPDAAAHKGNDPDTKVQYVRALLQCSYASVQSNHLKVASSQTRVALSIIQPLAAGDPENREYAGSLAFAHARYGHVLQADGDMDGAIREYQADIALREKLVDDAPKIPQPKIFLSISEVNLANALQAKGDIAGAKKGYGRCLELRSIVVANHPDNADWKRLKGECETALANLK